MPDYLPGGRKRATPAQRRYFAQANTGKPCAAPHCPRPRIWTSRWCATHRNKAGLWGHPEGRALDRKPVKKWRGIARQRKSAYGYKQTFRRPNLRSALPPTSDIQVSVADFRC